MDNKSFKSILEMYKEQYANDKLHEDFELPSDLTDIARSGINLDEYREALSTMRKDMDDNVQEMINKSATTENAELIDTTSWVDDELNRYHNTYDTVTEKELDAANLTRTEPLNAVIKRAFCPECGREIKSKFPVMTNAFTMERICRYDCECGAKFNLQYAYPRLAFYSDGEEIKVYTD